MPRLSAPIAVVASAALIASVGAGSYAAGLITSKDIKDGTIQVKDLSPKAVKQLKGATGATGATGAAGATGSAGSTGATGARGWSSWDPIPSGTLVKGGWYVDGEAQAANGDFGNTITMPGLATADLVWGVNVFFKPGADVFSSFTSATCTGTAAAPTAPAGRMCVYVADTQNALANSYNPLTGITRNTVGVVAKATGSGDTYASGTWAYTAN